ncbi:MAG: TonB-dependent receptor [Desulfobacteraceae bacterium]|nr:TonB-dependent receptor [Desulfobacteraceae bacterium]
MSKKLTKCFIILCLALGLTTASFGQATTGSIKGTITDNEGNSLPGVSVTASSPAMMGIKTYVTTETGSFRFPALPVGHYTIRAELPGFKTLVRAEIIVRIGMVLTIDFTMEMTTIEEEVTVTAASPTVDVEQSKISIVMDKDLLKNIPMARDLYDIVNSAPGAITENQSYRRTSSVHGATVRSNTYAFDGVNMNDPVVMYPLTNINFDVMDEVELVTAGHPASVGYTDGAYINVVTRSGGNKFSGGAVIYYTNEGMNQHLWTEEQVQALGVVKPAVDKLNLDFSATIGGPIIKDKLWFFSNLRYIKQEQLTNFIPFTDILGVSHTGYDWIHEEKMGFIKLTSQLASNVKLFGMFNYVDRSRPMYEEPGSRTIFQATRIWDQEKDYTASGILNYILDQNTFFDIRVAYVHRWFPIPMQDNVQDLPRVYEGGDQYGSLTNARFNETYLRKRFQVGTYFTRFQDNFLGGSHEFKGGVEFEKTYGDWDWWRQNPMGMYTDTRNPGNYYYNYDRGGDGVLNDGYIWMYICGPDSGSTHIKDKGTRFGAYIQDSATFGGRLTVNLGIRFDRYSGMKPAVTKTQSGSALAYWLGENIIRPYVATNYPEDFPQGLNPYEQAESPEWTDIIVWNAFSPRIGVSYDVFGDGKTAIKASFNRYTEYMMLQYFSTLAPFYPRSYGIRYEDQAAPFLPDVLSTPWEAITIEDRFYLPPTDYRGMSPEFAKNRLDPDTKSPINNELTFGVWQEVFKNFSLGVNFIHKWKNNILEDVLYAPDTDEYWYHIDQAATQGYWIPYNTTVPGEDDYPDRDVTFYVRSNDAPDTFYRITNVPELSRKYTALELIFNKRMSEGWQLSGSIVLSKAYGDIGGWYGESWGWSGAGDSPNWWVNRYGRQGIDRPLQIKLMGTAQLPYRIFLSAYYQLFTGSPWGRYASIRPDTAWCTANDMYRTYYGVYIEPVDTRKNRGWNSLDLRLEKEFLLGDFGRLGIYIDALNVLGWSNVDVGRDDIYRWGPDAEGFGQTGSVSTESGYKVIDEVEGLRTVKFSIRFSF